jgi:hypothetical protein
MRNVTLLLLGSRQGGRRGLWSKADSQVLFDNFEARP